MKLGKKTDDRLFELQLSDLLSRGRLRRVGLGGR
jgi:hypothetical protein